MFLMHAALIDTLAWLIIILWHIFSLFISLDQIMFGLKMIIFNKFFIFKKQISISVKYLKPYYEFTILFFKFLEQVKLAFTLIYQPFNLRHSFFLIRFCIF